MSKNIIEEITEQYLFEKYSILDSALKQLLLEHGIYYNNAEELKQELLNNHMQIIQEYSKTDTHETFTFKLCLIEAQKVVKIPHPVIISPQL